MAQIPRTGASPAPTTINTVRATPGGKSSAGLRNVGASEATPVDELNSQTNVAFDDSLLFHDDAANDKKEEDHQQGGTLIEYLGSSETFASIFKEVNPTADGKDGAPAKTGLFTTLVTRAINVYETNSRIIANVSCSTLLIHGDSGYGRPNLRGNHLLYPS